MKMKPFVITSAICIVLHIPVAASAQKLIAGWDFSQYFGANFLSIDGVGFTNTLDANYSDLDPTLGAGAESAAFGTMLLDGSAGSTPVNAGSGSEPFIPTSGSLASNLNAPALVAFDQHTVLEDEGQQFTELLSMTSRDAVNVVFEADLTSVTQTSGSWGVSFGGKTLSGTASVGIDFSTDGASYASFGSVELTDADALFSVPLGSESSDRAFVRLRLPSPLADGVNQAVIDNVAITVPEPLSELLGVTALLGVGTLAPVRRRRS